MQTIKTLDGTTHNVDYCGAADGVLFFSLSDAEGGLLTVATPFSDPDVTGKITYQMDNLSPNVYEGYTVLMGAMKDRYTGHITIQLIKEA